MALSMCSVTMFAVYLFASNTHMGPARPQGTTSCLIGPPINLACK
jgi:hypothetical protein